MPEAAPLRPGDPEHLGAYRLTGLVGEGGQGAVFLGEDADGGPVAVKLLHARFSGDPKARSRFAAEVAVAKRVSQFCTARVLDSDVEGDRPYIVSEYIDGPSLSTVLADDGPRRGADLDRLAIGTMTALAAIHQAGVVHRDFKPGNVLLAPDGPRVIDFGIARALDATGTMSSVAVGTPAYMSPEQISGNQVGPAADVWSWAATMAYAANGRTAFGQDSIPAVMNRILNLPPDLGGLREPLRGVVLACLAKNPALRPTAQQVLAHLLSLAGGLRRSGAAGSSGGSDGSGAAGGGGAAQGDAEMLTQGAATAAAESARLRAVPTPPPGAPPGSLPALPPGPSTPPGLPPGSSPRPGASTPPGSSTPPPGSVTPPGRAGGAALPALPAPAPPPPGLPARPGAAGGWPGAHPAPMGPHQAPQAGRSGPGGTWPGRPTGPAGPGGEHTEPSRRRRGPGKRVLAGAGGAALVALVLLGTAILVQIGGEEGEDPPAGKTGGTLAMTAPEPLRSGGRIDPSHSYSGTGRFLAKQLYTGLTALGPDGRVRNMLATEIRQEENCLEWHIVLRGGTTFSNGEPVDGEAFARGWARAAATEEGAGPYLMADIEGFGAVASGEAERLSGVKVTPNGISLRLTAPNCDFPARLADPVFSPVPASAGEPTNDAFNKDPVGNGPFKLEGHTPDKRIVLVRNDAWAFGRAKLDRVEIRLATDAAASRAAFRSGDIGWGHLTGVTEFGSIRDDPGFVSAPLPFVRMLVPITARGPMESREARLAVSYALDRGSLSRLFGGVDAPARGLVPPGVPGFGGSGVCASCDRTDPAKAKQLAEQADLGPGTSITLSYTTSPTQEELAKAVETRLESVLGWKVTLKPWAIADYEEFRGSLVNDEASGLALFAWGPDYASPYTMLWPLLGGSLVATEDNQYYNLSGWKSDEFDQLMGQAVRTSSARQRTDLYKQAEKLALDDLALVPLLVEGQAALVSDKYVGLEMDFHGDPTLATAALK